MERFPRQSTAEETAEDSARLSALEIKEKTRSQTSGKRKEPKLEPKLTATAENNPGQHDQDRREEEMTPKRHQIQMSFTEGMDEN
ncbi:hypothetical protein H920_08314 [Fukomys damarensis]|uniref:Uncharacterized protein n=1 Tax=Fukomys damarensis TaxID=885580 RepID=A0A091DII0_FUKDA|nr:hypothetical protein H920_08314 [Fukomys damarensis]